VGKDMDLTIEDDYAAYEANPTGFKKLENFLQTNPHLLEYLKAIIEWRFGYFPCEGSSREAHFLTKHQMLQREEWYDLKDGWEIRERSKRIVF
jgi:hypothetical protein